VTRADDAVAVGRAAVTAELVAFVRAIRAAGVETPANAAVDAAQAATVVGVAEKTRLRIALRATLVTRAEDIDRFDRLFETFWERLDAAFGGDADGSPGAGREDDRSDAGDRFAYPEPGGTSEGAPSPAVAPAELATEPGGDGDDPTEVGTATYSPTGSPEPVCADVDGAGGPDTLRGTVERLAAALGCEPERRWAPDAGGLRVDARRALRGSLATGGTVIELPRRRRERTATRGIELVDVSRSVLETIDRGFLLRFLRALQAAARTNRILFFDSDVREVTTAFEEPNTGAALAALERAETEWGGGTRIGDAVRALRTAHPDAVDRRTAVLVISDGLEMGQIEVLEREMGRLARRGRCVLWLNPLASGAGYEPTARGMAAAYPHVDGFFAFAGRADLEELTRQLERYGPHGTVGFKYDPRRTDGTTRNQL
jgi:uncharacterized protein with von Willebrand factor type A (vWA) domain